MRHRLAGPDRHDASDDDSLLTHPPLPIYLVLTFLVLASSALSGYAMGKAGRRNWTHILLYSATLALAMYVILDLDYPRVGLITVNNIEQVLVELRKPWTSALVLLASGLMVSEPLLQSICKVECRKFETQ